ncbi:MAG: hypothetical protein V1821_00585 [bacterium]
MPETPKSPERSQYETLEAWLQTELRPQYESRIEFLNQNGLLEPFSESDSIGIVGADGRKYKLPKLREVEAEIRANPELWEKKLSQGLTELELTPFALPLKLLAQRASEAILRHYDPDPNKTKLFATKKNPNDPNEKLVPLELDANQPLFLWDKLTNADTDGSLVYYPTSFDPNNHGGKTKAEVIANTQVFPGWILSFQEANPNIPAEGQGKTKNGRKQLEANQTPNEYLKTIQANPQYQNEQGQIPEQWLSQFLKHLEKTNQVVDDWQGNSKASYLVGSYVPTSGVVPVAYWNRGYRQAYLGGFGPRLRYGNFGVRVLTRVN